MRPPLCVSRRDKSVSKESRPSCSYSVREVTVKILPRFGINYMEVPFLVLNGFGALIWHLHDLHYAVFHVDLCDEFKDLPLP